MEKIQCDWVINISLCGTIAAPSNWGEQMEEGSYRNFDNLLCEISPPFSQERSWKLILICFASVMRSCDGRLKSHLKIQYSIDNFCLLTILFLHLLFPSQKWSLNSFKKTHLYSSNDTNASFFIFSSLHWELETTCNICCKIQTHLSKSSDASSFPFFSKPYFSFKFKTKQKPTCTLKTLPLLCSILF